MFHSRILHTMGEKYRAYKKKNEELERTVMLEALGLRDQPLLNSPNFDSTAGAL